jgi:hypothetical protein
MRYTATLLALLTGPTAANAADFQPQDFHLNGVELIRDAEGLRVTLPQKFWQDPARNKLIDRDFVAWLPMDFHDGVIEADVKAQVAPGGPEFARGFVGFAFRHSDGKFENIYLRPTNGVTEDQVRRNHAVQYAAFPDWRFDRLRRESPERYETAADIAPGMWVHMRIDVLGSRAAPILTVAHRRR